MKAVTSIRLENYLLDVLMRDLVGHDRSTPAYLVFLLLYAQTFGAQRRSVTISLAQLAERTGLSKSAVQSALRILHRRKLIYAHRKSRTAVPEYWVHRVWAR
jgi:DNA-binding MarR family transcriptional regulator